MHLLSGADVVKLLGHELKHRADWAEAGSLVDISKAADIALCCRNHCMECRSFNGRKTRQERSEASTFSMLVEVRDNNQYVLHSDVAASVDAILAGRQPMTEIRSRAYASTTV